MQFQYNSDYPDRFYNTSSISNSGILPQTPSTNTPTSILNHNHNNNNISSSTTINTNIHNLDARDPYHFPPVQPISCTRITTRIYNPVTQTISTVPNVLVKTQPPPVLHPSPRQQQQQQSSPNQRRRSSQQYPHRLSVQSFDLNQFQRYDDHDEDENMDSDSDFSSNDDDDEVDNTNFDMTPRESGVNDDENVVEDPITIAYWIQNIIREAIYGRVYKAIVLRKIHPQQKQQLIQAATMAAFTTTISTDSSTRTTLQQQQQQQMQNNITMLQNVEWEITNYDCAVKEMSWQHIRKERDRLAEDPVKEVCAMQYFKNWYNTNHNHTHHPSSYPTTTTTTTMVHTSSSSTTTTTTTITHPIMTTTTTTTTIPSHPTVISSTNHDPANTNNNTTGGASSRSSSNNAITTSFQQMLDTNVMMPLDLLSDEKYLYSIMPFCNGGELFELLNMNDRFTEAEARYWMHQVLNGIESLQHAGICHRDMSLENLLVHNSGALIIDMGMCLRIPFQLHNNNGSNNNITTGTTTMNSQNLSSSFNNMRIVNTGGTGTLGLTNDEIMIDPHHPPDVPSVRNLRRYMMKPQGTCGKWHYMSPEIHNNNAPFDGYTVDMWAAGVILFLMLTGFPPWDRPSLTDERFKYMSAGYLVQMLTEWEIGLSSDAMDLLQRMMFLDPKDRLSLDQVRAHPWMVNGPRQPPTN